MVSAEQGEVGYCCTVLLHDVWELVRYGNLHVPYRCDILFTQWDALSHGELGREAAGDLQLEHGAEKDITVSVLRLAEAGRWRGPDALDLPSLRTP